MASTANLTLACPDIIMIGTDLSIFIIFFNKSIPSLSPLSNLMSIIAKSGNFFLSLAVLGRN